MTTPGDEVMVGDLEPGDVLMVTAQPENDWATLILALDGARGRFAHCGIALGDGCILSSRAAALHALDPDNPLEEATRGPASSGVLSPSRPAATAQPPPPRPPARLTTREPEDVDDAPLSRSEPVTTARTTPRMVLAKHLGAGPPPLLRRRRSSAR